MNEYLLDTNHSAALLRDHEALWNRMEAASDAHFMFSRPGIGELWFMVYNSTRVRENESRLRELIDLFDVSEFETDAAEEYGRICAELRRAGRPIPQIDVQIAAIARVHHFVVLTSDRHFRAVQHLQVEDWLDENV